MVSLRTSGSTDSKMGNAMSQESAQALGHTLMKSPPQPTLLKVLIIDTTHVITTERMNGMTTPA